MKRRKITTAPRSSKQSKPTNLDLKKTLRHLYAPSKSISVVNIPPFPYLMIDGKGNPNTSQQYLQSIQSLYSLSYTIRAMNKEKNGNTFTVMPLEGLWTYEGQENPSFKLTEKDKDTFEWTLMIMQPDFVTGEIVDEAKERVRKKKSTPERLDDVRFETYEEGDAVQLMYIGAYDDEGPSVKKLHDYIEENGWKLDKRHHEIYLSDARKTAPERLRTVIRQPFDKEKKN